MRTTKIGAAFYEIVTALELDGQTPITGLTSGDFTINTYRNGSSESVSYDVSEVGSGHYLLSLSTGFSTAGYRMIATLINDTGVLQRTDLQVSSKDIDDVYSEVTGEAVSAGINTVTFTIQDSSNSNAAVAGVAVKVYNSSLSAIVSFGETDTNGQVDINLDPGTYIIKTFISGYRGSNTSVVVANQSTQSESISIDSNFVSAPEPSIPPLCRLYMDFIDFSGVAEEGKQVSVSSEISSSGSNVITKQTKEYFSDASGRVQFDAIQNSYISVTVVGAGITKTVLVPEQSTKSLSDLLSIKISSSVEDTGGLFVVVE